MKWLIVAILAYSAVIVADDKADIYHGEKAFHYTVENGTELLIHSESGKSSLVVFCDKPESLRSIIVLNEPVEIDRQKPPITVITADGNQGFETSVRVLGDGRKILLVDPDNMRMVHKKSTRFVDAIAKHTEITIDMNVVKDGLNELFDKNEYLAGIRLVARGCGYTPK